MRIPGIILCAAVLGITVPSIGVASGVYKWVDKNGKVHYSQHAPAKDGVTKLKTPPQRPDGADSEPGYSQGESVRGPDGKCLTIKCRADEMEAARLKRYREYDRQRAENQRHIQKKSNSTQPLISDAYMNGVRTQCLHGRCGSSTRNCDDMAVLRQCALTLKLKQDIQIEKYRKGVIDRDGYPRY